MKKIFMFLAAVLLMVITGCGGSDSTPAPLSSAKAFTAFNIASPVVATGVITGNTIAVTVPNGTPVTALVATFTTTGISVTVDSIPQTSGSTTNNFSSGSLTYTVTAADGSKQNYTVTVTVSSSLSGFLDKGFGTAGTGIVTTTIGNITYKILALGIQPSTQKIVVAGSSYDGSKYKFALVRYTKDGILDTTFGTAGIVIKSIGTVNDEAFALGIQSDESIVVAGSSYIGSKYNFALVKYTKDGILDTTFGTAGIVNTPIGSGHDYASALGIQSDGKIVVAGSSYMGSKYDFSLVRYNADGTLDENPVTGFGAAHTGKVTTSIGIYYDYSSALVIQPDDTILVAGRSSINNFNTTYEFALVKYTKDGIPDATFGADHTGKVTTSIRNINIDESIDEAHTLGIQPSNGKIVVAGSSYNSTSSNYDFALVRYNTDGTLDANPVTGFGAAHTGIVTTPIGSNYAFAYALGIQSDESIVAAGFFNNGSNFDYALVKYTKDGSPDAGFGTGGIATTPIGSSADYAWALGIQSDGKIVVAGTFYNGSNFDYALVRYLP